MTEDNKMPTPMTIEMEADGRQAALDALYRIAARSREYVTQFSSLEEGAKAAKSLNTDMLKIKYAIERSALLTKSDKNVSCQQLSNTDERQTALDIVNEQANDEGIWFISKYASEAYLQKQLRRLHNAVEKDALQSPRFSDEHCKDCCCARCWKALGITEYTGKSIPEHIEELKFALQSPRVPVIDGLDEAIEYVNDFANDVDDEGLDRDGNARHFFAVVKAARAYAELQKGN